MVDATYGETNLASPGPSSIYLQAHANLSPFADTGRPTEAYRPVADYNASFEHEWEMTDVVSPASMGRDVIWWATEQLTHFGFLDRAYDPYETWIKPLCGDWAGLRGCADVFTNLATAVEHMGDNVYHSALKLPAVWQGNAADACQSHLISIQACLFAAATPFRAIAVEYKSAAMGAHDFRKTLSSLLSDLLDAALIFAIEVAAAGATSETIVGAIIFGGAAFYEGKIIVDLVRELIDVYGRFNAMVDATSSSVNDFGLVDADYALPRLPLATISPPS